VDLCSASRENTSNALNALVLWEQPCLQRSSEAAYADARIPELDR